MSLEELAIKVSPEMAGHLDQITMQKCGFNNVAATRALGSVVAELVIFVLVNCECCCQAIRILSRPLS